MKDKKKKDKKKNASKASKGLRISKSLINQRLPNSADPLKSWSRIKNELESALTTWEGNALAHAPGSDHLSENSQVRPGGINQDQLQKIKKLLNSITQQLETFSEEV